MSERVPAPNKTSATPPQATQASSPLLHQGPFTSGLSESLGDDSNISKQLGGIQPKTIRRSLNWQNISVEAPSRSAGRSLPGGIQLQQEEPSAVSGNRVSADSVQKSPLESSNSTISTEAPAQKPLIARAPFNGRNIPVEAPSRSWASSTYPGGIQRLETSGVKEQEESTESFQMQPQGAIQTKSSESEPQEKEEQNQELVQTKLTVGAPGDKYEQEADTMAAKVMTMPDSAIQQPIQRQTGEETEAVQMQPLVNSITPLVQRESDREAGQNPIPPLKFRASKLEEGINKVPKENSQKWQWSAELQDIKQKLYDLESLLGNNPSGEDLKSLEEDVKEAESKLKKLETKVPTQEQDKKAQWRALVNKATHIPPAQYSRGKHWQGNSEDQRRNSSKNGGAGQFLYSMTAKNVEELEKETLLEGEVNDKGSGTYHAFKTFSQKIGYTSGEDAHTLRAELTSAQTAPTVHSHPR